MLLTPEEVQHIAHLARLELTQEELTRYSQQLSRILDYFHELQAVDTNDIPPTTSGFMGSENLRPDNPRIDFAIDDLLRNAPDSLERQFRVPPVFD